VIVNSWIILEIGAHKWTVGRCNSDGSAGFGKTKLNQERCNMMVGPLSSQSKWGSCGSANPPIRFENNKHVHLNFDCVAMSSLNQMAEIV
jgi:hypothetical protein